MKNWFAVVLLACSVGACTETYDDGGIPAISVTVQPDGSRCVISKQEMPCTEVATYIRDVAKIGYDKRIEVTGDIRKTNERHFAAVIKSIKAAGFTFVYGAFDVQAPSKP